MMDAETLEEAMRAVERAEIAERFVRESNRIEGILRDPTGPEIAEHMRFVSRPKITVKDLQRFVSIYQPGKELREHEGMDVYVGDHVPPAGGPTVRPALLKILRAANDGVFARFNRTDRARIAFNVHFEYETLHPFMDGNGRSGRALWAWCMMSQHPLGFLHHWYYQSLQFSRESCTSKDVAP